MLTREEIDEELKNIKVKQVSKTISDGDQKAKDEAGKNIGEEKDEFVQEFYFNKGL